MLDLFTIFTKSGIVLWCFQGIQHSFTEPVNALIRDVILQERTGKSTFTHDSLELQYKLDNEFELVFVVAYQKIVQLLYIDKLISDVHLAFRDKYKDRLSTGTYRKFDFDVEYQTILKSVIEEHKVKQAQPKKMRTFKESEKSRKTIASLKVDQKNNNESNDAPIPEANNSSSGSNGVVAESASPTILQVARNVSPRASGKPRTGPKGRVSRSQKPSKTTTSTASKEPHKKADRVWSNGGSTRDQVELDYSSNTASGDNVNANKDVEVNKSFVGTMKGQLKTFEEVEEQSASEESSEEEEEINNATNSSQPAPKKQQTGLLSFFKTLTGQKIITKEGMVPILEKMKEHLIAKNVAADIADQLCSSVSTKLEGKVIGTFGGITSEVKKTLAESLTQLLSPRRQIDILRDCMEAKRRQKPYSITFCGVNGVGKSTNLAKICFWLMENGYRVLIAACDTFRAGAVEQLRTHVRHLNALHPAEGDEEPSVILFEKGYGKDAAGIAMDAINFAQDRIIDVVLIDTAGRMQDNEPLMRSLAKLVHINEPDLVLFVGEALVGNEAVDQLKKFNHAMMDFSKSDNPRLIDGILLTKFDTIDDKVGAAISMTYTAGQPIVFVGTGQTYADLKRLNVQIVVNSLLKG
ncbi:Signal recognition particle receptor subunit alpha [Trichoplax sp. H2]|nr:Signal recognition particle receptor subunit alpha [Trichoplax sp. H2]|eukprot:RDD41640.1 Signal recognition particle receptor subunit alpha [Trichoplax sp. H2]